MKCFNKKNQHVGPLKTLCRVPCGWDTDEVFRWCPECGAAVADQEYDGRTKPGKMMFPKLLRRKLKNG